MLWSVEISIAILQSLKQDMSIYWDNKVLIHPLNFISLKCFEVVILPSTPETLYMDYSYIHSDKMCHIISITNEYFPFNYKLLNKNEIIYH